MKTATHHQRARLLNRKPLAYLFDHILDGFKTTTEGIEVVYKEGIISEEEHTQLLKQNAERLIQRIHEFKITHKLLSLFFAGLFFIMQVQGDDLEMRRPTRTRTTRSVRPRNSRRKDQADYNELNTHA